MRRYPNQLRMPPNYRCVYDQDGGILLAAKALEAFQVRETYTHFFGYRFYTVPTVY